MNNAIDALNASLKVVSNLSGNIAGDALLANTLYNRVGGYPLFE
ncbi:hypothetical protein SAMN02745115_01737 [[Eubacterium] yurii]|nr:hypothetical protein SAMN02745115_01737 [[Eubacterium] yurii]